MLTSRLGRRFMILVIGVSSLVILALTAVQAGFDYYSDLADLDTLLDRVGLSLAPSLTESLWQLDAEQIDLQMTGIMSRQQMSFAAVRRDDGVVVKSKGNMPADHYRLRVFPLVHHQEGKVYPLGRLEMYASTATLVSSMWWHLLTTLTCNAIALFLLAFVILYLAHVLIIRRIQRLAVWVFNFGEGQLNPVAADVHSPLIDPGDEISGLFAVARDMRVKRLKAEDTLRLGEQRHHQEMLRAEAANAAKSAFLANMSHELRTPLTAILGFTELLADMPAGEHAKDGPVFLQRILTAARHLLTLVSDLLLVSTAEIGGIKLRRQRVDLAALCRHCLDMQSLTAMGRDLSVACEAPAEVWLYIDADRVMQIVNNLLANAIKFSRVGGSIGLRVIVESEQVLVKVWDKGIGIAPEDHATIFDIFARVDTSRTSSYPGVGLGLAIARHLVELHDGRIWLDSRPEQGSVFTFSLPLNPGAEAARVDR